MKHALRLFVAAALLTCSVRLEAQDQVASSDSIAPDTTPQLVIDAQGFSGRISLLALSDDGQWLAGVDDKNVRIWNLRANQLHAVLRGYQEPDGFHIGAIDSITFAPDNRHFIVGVSDNTELGSTRVYDLAQPDEIKQLIAGHTGCTRNVTFTRSGNRMATWGCDGFVIFYKKDRNGNWLVDFKVSWKQQPTAANNQLPMPPGLFRFTEDGRFLAFQYGDPFVISVQEQRIVRTSREVPPEIMELITFLDRADSSSYTDWTYDGVIPALAPAGPRANLFGISFGMAKRNNSPDDFIAASWGRDYLMRGIHKHNYKITALAWNRNAKLAATADALGEIHIWDPTSGRKSADPIRALTKSYWDVRWAPDGKSLLYTETSHPSGKFRFNQWGSSNKQLSLETFLVTSAQTQPVPHAVKPRTRHPQLGTIELAVAQRTFGNNPERDAIIGQWDLEVRFPGQNRPNQSLIPWGDPAREAEIYNYRIRVPQRKFGMVRSMRFVEYPGCQPGATCIFCTDTGLLFEATVEQSPRGSVELHLRKQFLGHTTDVTAFDVSPDGRKLASCSLDGTIRIYPLRPAQPTGDLDALTDGTGVVAVPPGGNSARAGLLPQDALLQFDNGSYYERIRKQQNGNYKPGQRVSVLVNRYQSETETQQLQLNIPLSEAPELVMPLTSILRSRSGQWVAWTPEGYYDSSSNGGSLVGWHINRARHETAQFFRIEQFQKQYYQPKVVRYAIEMLSSSAAVQRADAELESFSAVAPLTMVPAKERPQRIPPRIDIISPAPNAISTESKLRVVTRIRIPSQTDLSDVWFQVDGHSVTGRPRLTNESSSGQEKELWYEQQIELAPGKRRISAHAQCTNDTQAEQSTQCAIGSGENPPSDQGTMYILAIGLSQYQNESFSLQFGSKDAQDFVTAWTRLANRTPVNIQSKLLTNEQATCQGIRENGLLWLTQQDFQDNDTVLVFLSGHGVYDENEDWYFAGYEVDPDRLISTGISDAELNKILRKIPTNLILFTDSCHAGGFESTKKVFRNPPSGTSVWRGRGHIVFASCLPEQQSFEDPQWQNGAFTKGIVQFLSSPRSDYDNNGELTFDEMVLFVKNAVRNMTGKDRPQDPTIEMPSTVSNIPFTRP